jgi:type III pantothenate kinase
MLLVADIGNTNITLGFFKGDEYIKEIRIASDRDLSEDEYESLLKDILKGYDIDGCVIGSVVDELNEKFKTAVDKVLGIDSLFVSNDIKTGVTVKIDKPEELGADRIANAVAATSKYNGAVIVVDFGTATSFDVINSKREFLGGVIAPGVKTQLKSLYNATSKLPKIEADITEHAIGHNTTEAILSGVVRGTACMVEGIISQCEKELGEKATVVATGGNSRLIAHYIGDRFDAVDPIFTLVGLKCIYELNRGRK